MWESAGAQGSEFWGDLAKGLDGRLMENPATCVRDLSKRSGARNWCASNAALSASSSFMPCAP